ncbi:MAG: YibE/F family protein [Bacillota bacterium]
MRRIWLIGVAVFIFIVLSSSSGYGEESTQYERYTAVITQIREETENGGIIDIIQARFTDGPYENKEIRFEHMPIKGTRSDIQLKKGMSIIISLQIADGKIQRASLLDVERRDTMKVLALAFLTLLVVFGGFKGIRAAFSLILTFLLIVFVLVPLILNKFNPIFAAIITSSIAILINFLIISGFSRKSLCAIISTIGGTIIAGLSAFYFGNLMALTGLSDETVQTLVAYTDIPIDYRGLLFSGIIIGAIGAVMDVSMSITSFIFEIKEQYPRTSPASLFSSGLNVGKDMMSTMANTLILAYAGASLPLFLFFSTMDVSFMEAINMEFISEEILRSLCGTIGLIMAIPISSFMASIRA